MTNQGWQLVLPFDTDDAEFVRGFEAGRMWERIKSDHTDWDETVHSNNTEMIMRMCERENRSFRAEILDETFVRVHIS